MWTRVDANSARESHRECGRVGGFQDDGVERLVGLRAFDNLVDIAVRSRDQVAIDGKTVRARMLEYLISSLEAYDKALQAFAALILVDAI